VISEECAPPETKAEAQWRSYSVRPGEAKTIDITFSGAHIRIPMSGENFLDTLRVILEYLK
jgi:hypothetical protein